MSEYIAKASIEPRDYRVVFLIQSKGPAAKRRRTFSKSYFYNERIKRWNEALPSSVHL